MRIRRQIADGRWQITGRRKPPTPTMSFSALRKNLKENLNCIQTLRYAQGDSLNVILSGAKNLKK